MEKIEEIVDIPGSEHLAPVYGDRYLGWYFSKIAKEPRDLLLKESLTYSFKVCDYNYRFIMPSKIDFKGGLLTYTTADRELGVFRFPRDPQGEFVAPIHLRPKDLTLNFTKEEAERMLLMKSPLVFEAFKISQYGFEFIDLSDQDIHSIETLTDKPFADKIKEDHAYRLTEYINEVLEKIKSIPNFLLILQNILDKKIKNLDEAAAMSNQIIHI